MKVHKEMLDRWTKYAELALHDKGYTLDDVTNVRQAWDVAHYLGFSREAYHMDTSINDNHIETALRRIFPNMEK